MSKVYGAKQQTVTSGGRAVSCLVTCMLHVVSSLCRNSYGRKEKPSPARDRTPQITVLPVPAWPSVRASCVCSVRCSPTRQIRELKPYQQTTELSIPITVQRQRTRTA